MKVGFKRENKQIAIKRMHDTHHHAVNKLNKKNWNLHVQLLWSWSPEVEVGFEIKQTIKASINFPKLLSA
jgi:hypothetical protein